MRLRTPAATPSRRMARPIIPTPARPPRAARVATGALAFLAAYGALALLTYADLLVRLTGALLAGGSLPTWAFIGFGAAAVVLSIGTLVTRALWHAARQVRDQDPRASIRLVLPFTVVLIVHATLVTGPLNRWGQAAPVTVAPFIGDSAVLLIPLVVLAAVAATIARRRADAWLNALPD